MLVLIGFALALIPAVAILYPFLKGQRLFDVPLGKPSTLSELNHSWARAMEGLRNTELDLSIGNLTKEDYDLLHDQYVTDAVRVLRAMEAMEELNETSQIQKGDGEQNP